MASGSGSLRGRVRRGAGGVAARVELWQADTADEDADLWQQTAGVRPADATQESGADGAFVFEALPRGLFLLRATDLAGVSAFRAARVQRAGVTGIYAHSGASAELARKRAEAKCGPVAR